MSASAKPENRPAASTGVSSPSPALAVVFGHFSSWAERRNWRGLDDYLNPQGMFSSVHVVALGDDGDYPATHFGSVVAHPVRSVARSAALKRVNDIYTMTRAVSILDRLVREESVRIITHVVGTPIKFGLPGVIVARGRREVASVITLCSDYPTAMRYTYSMPMRMMTSALWRYVFRRATAVRSKSRFIASFAREYGVPSESVWTIPNKEVLDFFSEPPSASALEATASEFGIEGFLRESVVFLTVGRLIRAKNHDRILRALSRCTVQLPHARYLIAGRGPCRRALEARVREIGLGDRVHFLGNVPHSQLRDIYHLSDVFLFPTLYEGQPRAVLEAMLAGLPVICSNEGAVCELVRNGRDGVWVDPKSVESIADAMSLLAGDRNLRERLSDHSDVDFERFSIASVGAREAELYRTVLHETV